MFTYIALRLRVVASPEFVIFAQGKLGRKLLVLPKEQLVITRLGDQSGNSFNFEFFKRLRLAKGK